MNITPISSKSKSYSILESPHPQGTPIKFAAKISVVLLSRGSWIFKPQVLAELFSFGFSEILSIETPVHRLDYEALVEEMPNVRFLLLQDVCSTGEQINIAAQEAKGDFLLVLWDDQKIHESGFHAKVQKILSESPVLCQMPELKTKDGLVLPTIGVPSLHKNRIQILFLSAETEDSKSLFPFDFCGFYERQKFLLTGGFDPDITNEFWQKVDWGTRAHLWGEKLIQRSNLKVDYVDDPPIEDHNRDFSYKIYFLKNIAPQFSGDSGKITNSHFTGYWLRSGQSLPRAWAEFATIQKWVEQHRFRFKTNSQVLFERWGEDTL